MGRAYRTEMRELEQTYQEVKQREIDCDTIDSMRPLLRYPLVSCGVGGSMVAADYISRLHRVLARQPARSATTFDVYSEGVLSTEAAFVVSSGGRNKDALRALEKMIECDAAELGILTANIQSPLANLASEVGIEAILDIASPRRKDGYLATNTLLASCMTSYRLYAKATGENDVLPGNLISLLGQTPSQWQEDFRRALDGINESSNLLILHSGWGGIAGCDAESRLHEAGLLPVQAVDVRNFAHGRHYWPARRGENTIVWAFSDSLQENLVEKTIALLPKEINAHHFRSEYSGPVAGLDHLIKSMLLVGLVGELLGIDPGRPSVPQWGRKIYSMGPGPKPKVLKKSIPNIGSFRGIVLDFDGTCIGRNERSKCLSANDPIIAEFIRLLQAGLHVGLASGRGRSLWDQLAAAIPSKFHNQVLLGYYNGGIIRSMAEGPIDRPAETVTGDLNKLLTFLERLHFHGWLTGLEVRSVQINVRPIKPSDHERLVHSVKAEIQSKGLKVKIATSSLGLDCFSENVSKLSIVTQIAATLGCSTDEILRIGDRADIDGNDFELLNHPLGISVDKYSHHPINGSSPLRPELRGRVATEKLLSSIEIVNGAAKLNIGG